jgi:hypothetical protein
MALEVDFITLGDASDRLGVPAPTLRHWTDQMEEYNVHFVLRNNRNERIYEEDDIKIFAYLRDLKNEYGRKTTTKDLGYMIVDKANKGELKIRSREDAPPPQPSNKTADLLGQEDIQQLMQSERVRQFIGIIVGETTKNIKEDLMEEVRAEILESKTYNQLVLEELENRRIKREEEKERKEEEHRKYIEERERMREERDRKARLEWEQKQEERERELLKIISELKQDVQTKITEKPKGFLQRLLGK